MDRSVKGIKNASIVYQQMLVDNPTYVQVQHEFLWGDMGLNAINNNVR